MTEHVALGITAENVQEIAARCVELVDETEWILRRKHRIEFSEPGLIRHHTTVDFELPIEHLATDGVYWLPLLTLPKAPGNLFRFDVSVDGKHSTFLRSRAENSGLSVALLLSYLEPRVTHLCTTHANAGVVRQVLLDEVRAIALADSQIGQRIVRSGWTPGPVRKRRQPRKQLDKCADHVREAIRTDSFAWWLLRTVAHSSFVAFRFEGPPGERHVFKISYDEVVSDISSDWSWKFWRSIRSLSYRSGFRSLPVTFVIPWASARSFHFEAHVPDGLIVSRPGSPLRGEHEVAHPRHIHSYWSRNEVRRIARVAVNYRLAPEEYGLVSYGVAFLVALLLGLAAIDPTYLWTTTVAPDGQTKIESAGGAAAILLVVPGVLAAFFARVRHPVARRLGGLSRILLLVVAAGAFAAAARISVIGGSHPPDASELRDDWFIPLASVAAFCGFMLALRRVSTTIGVALHPFTTGVRKRVATRRSQRSVQPVVAADCDCKPRDSEM